MLQPMVWMYRHISTRSAVLLRGNAGKQNFLDGYHAGKKKETEGGGVGKGFLAILISLAVMLVGLAVCITVRTLKKQELQKLKEYNESSGNDYGGCTV